MLVVYTTVIGNTKPLHEPEVESSARFVCYTDQEITSPRWEMVRIPSSTTPSRDCRKLKQLSHAAFPDSDATLWIDSNFSLLVDPHDLLGQYPHPITTFRHPHRNRISDEAKVIVSHGKAPAKVIAAQLATYQADGFDTDTNPQACISAGGFVLRRHTRAVRDFNQAWHHEVQTRSLRDQMSIDYCAWKCGLPIHYFPGSHLENDLARFTRYKRPAIDF